MKHGFKKVVAASIVACMAVGFAGCGNKTQEQAPENQQVVDGSQQTDNGDTQQAANGTSYQVSERDDAVYAGLDISNENKHLGDILDYARSLEDRASYVPILHKDQIGAADAFRIFGFDDTALDAYALAVTPMSNRAYAVGIMKPAEGMEETINDGLEALKADTEALFLSTLPDQASIATSAATEKVGDYIVFVMCSDVSYVMNDIKKAIEQPDLINEFVQSVGSTPVSGVGTGTNAEEPTIGGIEEVPVDTGSTTPDTNVELGGIEVGGIEGDVNASTTPTTENVEQVEAPAAGDTSSDWQ